MIFGRILVRSPSLDCSVGQVRDGVVLVNGLTAANAFEVDEVGRRILVIGVALNCDGEFWTHSLQQ
jgi:hypothetical protein